jgi:acetylornithine deacetylase/succinyl-diaminopimelate desuccinylase-like protein
MQKITIILLLMLGAAAVQAQGDVTVEVDKKYKAEVTKLVKNKKMVKVMELIKEQDAQTIEDLITLTEIEAPPFKEDNRGLKFKEMLEAYGADSVWIDDEGNVIGLRKGTKREKVVALDAHLDTVFPEGTDVKVRNTGDTLRAPGIADDTRGLAGVLAVLRAMEDLNIETEHDVLFIGSVGEEGPGDLRGVKFLFSENGPRIDSWIAVDGVNISTINTMGLGSIRYRVKFLGPGGHSWGAFGLANTHHALGSAIHYFVKAADEYTKDGPKTSYNVGIIGGGTSVNSIPFQSFMDIDMRSIKPERLEDMDRILKESVQKAIDEQNVIKRRGRPMTAEFEMIGNRPSGEGDPNLPLIQRALASAEALGEKPALTRGSTNSNIPISKGIPSITIGSGGKAFGAHSLAEWYYNDEGWKGTQMALLILVAESGLAK